MTTAERSTDFNRIATENRLDVEIGIRSRPLVPGRFTIAIPTYNRAGVLRRAIECALNQSYENVEVLVVDNASTDDTRALVLEFGPRVVYHRWEHNLGAFLNFMRAPFLATGEYFSWLQDDDLIYRDFAARATACFRKSPDVRVYTCYAADGPSDTVFIWPGIYGPGVPLDWPRGEPRTFPAIAIAPIGFFYSLGMAPTLACRTSAVREVAPLFPADCDLYLERIIPPYVAGDGVIAVDPWIGGMFFKHEQQSHVRMLSQDLGGLHWKNMAKRLGEFLQKKDESQWVPFLGDVFSQMAVGNRVGLLHDPCTQGIDFDAVHPLAGKARQILLDSLPPGARRDAARPPYGMREFLLDLTPPFLRRAIMHFRKRPGHR